MSLEDHIKQAVQITDNARGHHRKKLLSEAQRNKRMLVIIVSCSRLKRNKLKGLTPEDSARTAVLFGLKKQEAQILQAFDEGTMDEETALYKILEKGFLAK